jgi:hypothetical protein
MPDRSFKLWTFAKGKDLSEVARDLALANINIWAAVHRQMVGLGYVLRGG